MSVVGTNDAMATMKNQAPSAASKKELGNEISKVIHVGVLGSDCVSASKISFGVKAPQMLWDVKTLY